MLKKEKKEKNKITLSSLDKKSITNELNRVKYKSRYNGLLKSTIYTLIIIAALGTIIATLIMPVVQISGNAMNPNYYSGDIVVTLKTKNIKENDVIAFYQGNKILVKRVIAVGSNWINIDENNNILVNGIRLNEDYAIHKEDGDYNIELPHQVKNESYFVLSDNRENTVDSRMEDIGDISYDNVIGKVLFRVYSK